MFVIQTVAGLVDPSQVQPAIYAAANVGPLVGGNIVGIKEGGAVGIKDGKLLVDSAVLGQF